jgi:hypothetical protein
MVIIGRRILRVFWGTEPSTLRQEVNLQQVVHIATTALSRVTVEPTQGAL